MLRITTREFGIDLQLERLSENREVFAAKAADGKEYLLSVARTGTVAYDMLEKAVSENACIWDKTVEQDCYSERYVLQQFDEITARSANSRDNCNIMVSWCSEEYALSILKPNCYLTRFDVCYSSNAEWLKVDNGEEKFAIGYHEKSSRAWIGTLRIPLKPNELRELVGFIFSERKNIERISFRITRCDPRLSWPYVKSKESKFWYLMLPDKYAELTSRVRYKFRYRMKWDLNRLNDAADGVSAVCIPAERVPEKLIYDYFRFKSQKYQSDYSSYTAKSYLNRQQNSVTHVYALQTADGVVLAVALTAEIDNSACLVNMAYDGKWQEYSPGKLLYFEILRSLIDKGIKTLYLGSGEYDYKHYFHSMETSYWVGDFFRKT